MILINLVQKVCILFGAMVCQVGKRLGYEYIPYIEYLETLKKGEEKIILLERRVSELNRKLTTEKIEQYDLNQRKEEEIDELRKNLQNLMETVDFFKSSDDQSCSVQTTNKTVIKAVQDKIRETRNLLIRDIGLLEDNNWYEIRERGETIEGRLRDYRYSLEENNTNPQLIQTLRDMELISSIRNNRYYLLNNLVGQ